MRQMILQENSMHTHNNNSTLLSTLNPSSLSLLSMIKINGGKMFHGALQRLVYVIVISRCEYDILVIARVQGGAEDECSNQDIVQAHPGYNWLLSHKPNYTP